MRKVAAYGASASIAFLVQEISPTGLSSGELGTSALRSAVFCLILISVVKLTRHVTDLKLVCVSIFASLGAGIGINQGAIHARLFDALPGLLACAFTFIFFLTTTERKPTCSDLNMKKSNNIPL